MSLKNWIRWIQKDPNDYFVMNTLPKKRGSNSWRPSLCLSNWFQTSNLQGQIELILEKVTLATCVCFTRYKTQNLSNINVAWRNFRLDFHKKEQKVGFELMTFRTWVPCLTTRAKKVTLDLFVRQRRDRNEGELLDQPLVQPVEVFVAARHLDVVKLEQFQRASWLNKVFQQRNQFAIQSSLVNSHS